VAAALGGEHGRLPGVPKTSDDKGQSVLGTDEWPAL